jgi:hypothetical protein
MIFPSFPLDILGPEFLWPFQVFPSPFSLIGKIQEQLLQPANFVTATMGKKPTLGKKRLTLL